MTYEIYTGIYFVIDTQLNTDQLYKHSIIKISLKLIFF